MHKKIRNLSPGATVAKIDQACNVTPLLFQKLNLMISSNNSVSVPYTAPIIVAT